MWRTSPSAIVWTPLSWSVDTNVAVCAIRHRSDGGYSSIAAIRAFFLPHRGKRSFKLVLIARVRAQVAPVYDCRTLAIVCREVNLTKIDAGSTFSDS
jgi:hypothetical protein